MNIEDQIKAHIANQPEPKRSEIQKLHSMILEIMPSSKLWFLDGKDENGKMVTNPDIGYGHQTIKYADGKTKEFYQVGISATKTGISVYIIGIKDKKHLGNTFAEKIGKAIVTGYCIKFKTLKDINIDILKTAIQFGFEHQKETE